MDLSRPARNTESECGAVVFIDTSNSECRYPQVQRDRMIVLCPMEHCVWVGEAQLLEDHSKEKHPPYTVRPAEYQEATHMLIPKEGVEKVESLQEEAGKLGEKIQKTREELHESENKLLCCVNQIQTLQSQNMKKADPVIPQRSEMANQQSGTGGANSTASLGRANQPLPPPQERCSTLDARDSDYQQFKDMTDQEEEELELLNYRKPEPQTEQKQGKEALAVGSKQWCPSPGSDDPPPLPPKPKTSLNNSSSSDVPPELPPKPLPKSSPRHSQQVPKDPSGDAEQPPPRPPKPGQIAQAGAVVPHRRARRPPTPSTTSQSTTAKSDGDNCSRCVQLQEQCAKLQENCAQMQGKNDRLTCLLKKQMLTKNSNTCPALFRDSKSSNSRFRSPTF